MIFVVGIQCPISTQSAVDGLLHGAVLHRASESGFTQFLCLC